MKPGLYLVSVPIGNTEDITQRALAVLEAADIIAAEDTRTSGLLLATLGIKKKLWSCHNYNEKDRAPFLIERIKQGNAVALISDAGTPTLCDPGYQLVEEAQKSFLPVFPIPGVSALTTILPMAGISTSQFVFEGYLPKTGKKRKARLHLLTEETRAIILYSPPHSLLKDIEDLYQQLGNRSLCIGREMTKKYEEYIYTTLQDAPNYFIKKKPKGEFTLVIAER